MPTVIHELADAFLRRKQALAERGQAKTKLAGSDYFMPKSAKKDLNNRLSVFEQGGLPELLKQGASEMYHNPIVNTAISLTPGAGDVQSGYEAVQSAKEGKWGEAGLNALGVLPFIPALGGIIAGRGAKTADLAKLATAEDMAKAGASREEIWNQTGWFQGPDKQWKFEIPDYKAEFTPTPEFFTKQGTVRQSDVFTHPELQKAGYGTEDIIVKRGSEEGGSFRPVLVNNELAPKYSDIEIGTTAVKENPTGFSFSPLTAKNINLHELQHTIQYKENFAKGGSPELFIEAKSAALQSLPELRANAREAKVAYEDAVNMGYPENLVNERKLAFDNAQSELDSNIALANMGDPTKLYNRLAGEVEARLVQKRMQMTPEELKANPPWTMYDVPEQAQVVSFDKVPNLSTFEFPKD